MSDNRTLIVQLKDFAGQQVTLAGWVYQARSSGKVQFIILRDGSGLCQCVVEKGKVLDEVFEKLEHLGQESSLTITGLVRKEDRSVGGYELADEKLVGLSTSARERKEEFESGLEEKMKRRFYVQ